MHCYSTDKETPKNHSAANKRRIREIQVRSQSRQRERSMSAERLLPPRQDKYGHVTSKLRQYLPRVREREREGLLLKLIYISLQVVLQFIVWMREMERM